jgi:sigma-E factor negative regulatory protein RseA
MNEKISALLDNELDERDHEPLLHELGRNPDFGRVWDRYHVIRAAMRNELEMIAPPGLAESIRHHLTRESSPARFPLTRRWTSPLVGGAAALAIAASVATVAVFSLRSVLAPDPSTTPSLTAQIASPPNAGVARSAQARSLDALLVKHGEFSATAGMGPIMPYMRVVGYDGER